MRRCTEREIGRNAGEVDELADISARRTTEVVLPATDRGRPRPGLQEPAQLDLLETLAAAPAAQQLSEVPRPTLENLGRLLAGYGATVADLATALDAQPTEPSEPTLGEGQASPDTDLLRSLAEAIRRVEGRQEETETRVQRIERGLEAAARPVTHLRPGGS